MEGSDLISKEKALPAVLQWLSATYEAARGSALPKRDVYTDYVNFCVAHSIEPTNAPAFGKLLRMVFPDITSRRLGRRGHTSHHYNHFRRKADNPNNNSNTNATNSNSVMQSPAPPPQQLDRPYSEEPVHAHNDYPHYPQPPRPFPFQQPPTYTTPYPQPAPSHSPTPMIDRPPYPVQGPRHTDFDRPHPVYSPIPPARERIGRYLHEGGTAAPQSAAAFMMGEESLRDSMPPSRIKSDGLSSLEMGQSSFGDEDFPMQQHRRYPFAPPHPPSHQAPPRLYSSLPDYPDSHLPPHPPLPPNVHPHSASLPSPSPYTTTQPSYPRATNPAPLPPCHPVEGSSLKALLDSPSFSLQGAESFNSSLSFLDPRIRGSTVPVVVSPAAYHNGTRRSRGSFSTARLSPPDIFPLDTGKVPMFAIDTQQLPYNDLKQEARHFTTMYRNHMQTVFIALTPPFDFDAVCSAVYMFWPQVKRFHRLFSSQCVLDQMLEIDSMLYSAMLSLLVPDLFEETPSDVLERIINFSRAFPEWLRRATSFVLPFTMYEFKLKVAENFSKALYNRAVINQLSIQLRRGLEQQKQQEKEDVEKPTMLEDWGALDFEYIDGQTWIFGEFKKIPATVKDNMPVLLSQRVQVEAWSKWLLEVTENVMKGHYAPYTLTVSEFLLKWTNYTSLISKYLIEIHSCNLELFLLLFCWIEALLALYLDEHEQMQIKRAKARPPSFSLRRNSLPGTASFSSLTPTPVGQTLIPNIMVADDDFSGF